MTNSTKEGIVVSSIQMIIFSILIIFGGTVLGSALVFFFKQRPSSRTYVICLGLASGVMIAAAFFGLLNPSIEDAKTHYNSSLAWLPPLGGFLLGGGLLYLLDKIVPHIHNGSDQAEGPNSSLSKHFKFFLAVTLHNIPEGLVTGFACGLALSQINNGQMDLALISATSAMVLAIGIAIQNVPESFAISVPLYSDGMSKNKAFIYGSLSGIVEPILAVAGMFIASSLASQMSWFLSFGAGAMLYVTIDELLPEAHQQGLEHFGLWSFMGGFAVMMLMETLI